jgi:hypothetical protein
MIDTTTRLLIRARQWIVDEIGEVGEAPDSTTSSLLLNEYIQNQLLTDEEE